MKNAHDLKWFIDKIGKKIYRGRNKCNCIECQKVFNNGLIILDEVHANYLFIIQNETGVKYSDEKFS